MTKQSLLYNCLNKSFTLLTITGGVKLIFILNSKVFFCLQSFLAKRTNAKQNYHSPLFIFIHYLGNPPPLKWVVVIIFVEGRALSIFWQHFSILFVRGLTSPSYHCHFPFHVLPCLELTTRIYSHHMCASSVHIFKRYDI